MSGPMVFETFGSEKSDGRLSTQTDAHAEFGETCKAQVGVKTHATKIEVIVEAAILMGLMSWKAERAPDCRKTISSSRHQKFPAAALLMRA